MIVNILRTNIFRASISCGALSLILLSIALGAPKKKLLGIEKLYLTSLKLNARCYDKKEFVKFPDIGFVSRDFLTSLLSNFHRNNKKVELHQGLFLSNLSDYRKKIYYHPHWMYFENNFKLDRLTIEDRDAIRKAAGTPYELVLDLKTSVWEQEIKGKYIIYSNEEKLHSGSLSAVSTYIIKDKESPYVTDYDSEIDAFQNPLDHRGEITKVYSELGEQIGNDLRLLFIAPAKKEKKKFNKKKRRKKRKKQNLKFWDIMKPQY